MHVAAIIAAGGRGKRLGGNVPKQLQMIGGRTLLELSVGPFEACNRISEIIVVLSGELMASPPAMLQWPRTPLRTVRGGTRRQDSVAAGLDAVAPATEVVVVHDAARPFCTASLIERTIDAAIESGAAVSALLAHDTVKEGETAGAVTTVRATLPRERIFLAQTPQAFRVDILRDAVALGRRGIQATDEALLVERMGHRVRLIEGETRNIKITTEDDLVMARTMRAEPTVGLVRIGMGYDLHRLVEGRPLVLGGVTIPGKRGLVGHSDADAVCHAVTDAVLGAAAAGDIGRHFPDTDQRWKDVSSLELLGRAVEIIAAKGFIVGNVDVVIVAEWPSIRDHADKMRAKVASAIGIDTAHVAIKGKTNENVGALGRGEAIAVNAIALVYPTR